ncbi:hypothetical protein H6G96_09430 [Nostoc sp. FACHB-892]|uniref:hypothetical protein n=1 Tax=Nostoc sp. FACHB-892 TaxID=2692843 RepID=UPI00168443FB|nr:hypothetical protein [Nostoc sp. FACHB-892]MBD2726546.1 hypothetical protein [Nostoc sp. FACHB-892]
MRLGFTQNAIKEFLVSNDSLAVKIRQHLGERSLFDFAVKNLTLFYQTSLSLL